MQEEKIKKSFPIFSNNPGLIYLDNAATTQKPQKVIDTVVRFYTEYNANVHRGIHELSEKATEAYEQARATIAEFMNANPEEIIFTSGTTDAINKLAFSVAELFEPGDTILITEAEHHSNLLPWQHITKERELKLRFIKLEEDLNIDMEDLEHNLKKYKVSLIAISHISNVTGTVTDLKTVAHLAKKYKALVAVDGAQAIAHTSIDVKKLDIDFYAFSGHKMYGPTGIGVLWGRQELLNQMNPLSYGGGMINMVGKEESTWADLPEKHEAGTPNISGAIGLAEAAKFIQKIGFVNVIDHEHSLVEYATQRLKEIPQLVIYGPKKSELRSSVITFNINGIHPHDVAQILADQKVAVRAGHHCCQLLHKDLLCVPATVRASFAVYNTCQDIDKLIKALNSSLKQFSNYE